VEPPELDDEEAGALPRNVPPKRLVADLNADDAPVAPPEPPWAEADEFEDGAADVADPLEEAGAATPPSRKRSLRLNRNCGVISDTKFSAAVAPLNRSVASTTPVFTVAVRTAPGAGADGWFDADRLCQ
jgi:hypothetical protein